MNITEVEQHVPIRDKEYATPEDERKELMDAYLDPTKFHIIEEFLEKYDIDINNYNFLVDMCVYNNVGLLKYFKERGADFYQCEYRIFKNYLELGQFEIFENLLELYHIDHPDVKVNNFYDDVLSGWDIDKLNEKKEVKRYLLIKSNKYEWNIRWVKHIDKY